MWLSADQIGCVTLEEVELLCVESAGAVARLRDGEVVRWLAERGATGVDELMSVGFWSCVEISRDGVLKDWVDGVVTSEVPVRIAIISPDEIRDIVGSFGEDTLVNWLDDATEPLSICDWLDVAAAVNVMLGRKSDVSSGGRELAITDNEDIEFSPVSVLVAVVA